MTDPSNDRSFACRICERREIEPFVLKELMYGSQQPFDYARCTACGCLQIRDIPSDLQSHYGNDYYSFAERSEPVEYTGLKKLLAQWYCRSAALAPDSALGRSARRLLPQPTDFAQHGRYLVEARLHRAEERILDVGCGNSPYVLAAMRRCGFANVEGIDPFIESDTRYEGVPIRKCTIDQLQGEYGMVMFHHSLEHVTDPLGTLRHAARLLRPGGTCLVRVPVMGTWFWRHFGEHWVELDAPRHLHLFTVEAMRLMGERAGFGLRKTVFDSGVWEIAASIRYQRGISLVSTPLPTDGFSAEELSGFASEVQALNRRDDAGRACFYFDRQ